MSRSLALGSESVAQTAAQDYLVSGGSAVGAVLCGFFAAAGAQSSVLLGPLSILVGGIGNGVRAFDGRMRQPGLGTKRPRGFLPNETIPETARVAASYSVAAALVALNYDGSQRLANVLKPGIHAAQRSGAADRAALLKRISEVGAAALSEPPFVRAVLRVAGPSQGGLMTPSDLPAPKGVDHAAVTTTIEKTALYEAPWAREADPEPIGTGCAICAIDARGTAAALAYRRSEGLTLDDYEIELPLIAIPVVRGVERVSPGSALPSPAPIGITLAESGALSCVLAEPSAGSVESLVTKIFLRRDPKTLEVVTD